MEIFGFAILFIFGSIALVSISYSAGRDSGRYDGIAATRAEAVKAGYGEWHCDPVTGRTTFVFACVNEPLPLDNEDSHSTVEDMFDP